MMTDTQVWEVIRGFGDIVDAPNECFDVQVLRRKFASESDAAAFAEAHYERRVRSLMRQRPDWWQSFFVTVRRVENAARD